MPILQFPDCQPWHYRSEASLHSQILVVSRDPMLLQRHRLILGTYFDVEGAGRLSETGAILSQQSFDLVVLCDTLSLDECLQIAEIVHHRTPQPTLLSLQGPGRRSNSVVGRTIPWDGGPLRLLRECADVLGCDLHRQR